MERNGQTSSVMHQDKQGISISRVSENVDEVIRVEACAHVYIKKANEFCFSFYALLSFLIPIS